MLPRKQPIQSALRQAGKVLCHSLRKARTYLPQVNIVTRSKKNAGCSGGSNKPRPRAARAEGFCSFSVIFVTISILTLVTNQQVHRRAAAPTQQQHNNNNHLLTCDTDTHTHIRAWKRTNFYFSFLTAAAPPCAPFVARACRLHGCLLMMMVAISVRMPPAAHAALALQRRVQGKIERCLRPRP